MPPSEITTTRPPASSAPRLWWGELLAVFAVAGAALALGRRVGHDDPLAGQLAIWIAYAAMAGCIYLGLRLRGQGWEHLGLRFGRPSPRQAARAVGQSLGVLVFAVGAFVLGAVVGAPLFGLPEQADLSKYDWLRGNVPLLLAALPVVWLVSSCGEEIVFRGFLVTRVAELGGGSKWAWRVAVGVSAGLFGLAHYAWGPTGMLQTTLMGLALGFSYLWVRRNLWVTILTHVYMDTLLFAPFFRG